MSFAAFDTESAVSIAALWLIGVPLVALLVSVVRPSSLPTLASLHALVLLAMSAAAGATYLAHGDAMEVTLPPLFRVGEYIWSPQFLMDAVSCWYGVIVAVLVGVIFRFSGSYFFRERRANRYWSLVILLSSALMFVVYAGNVDVLLFGWELVGVCSVALISFFRQNVRSNYNSIRALVYYRICDALLLMAVVLMHHHLPSVAFSHFAAEDQLPTVGLLGVLLLLGSLAKAGQFPMSPWLPRAMEGPSTSSAIFYGALSVHLGPWLMLRTAPLWMLHPEVRVLMVASGVISAMYATIVGRVQSDAKTSLGYATIAQIGVIYIEIGLGLHLIAAIHMTAHAMLRVWQFLRSSSLIQDFQDNPLVTAGIRGRGRYTLLSRLPAHLAARVFVVANHAFYLSSAQLHFLVNPMMALVRHVDAWSRHRMAKLLLLVGAIAALALVGRGVSVGALAPSLHAVLVLAIISGLLDALVESSVLKRWPIAAYAFGVLSLRALLFFALGGTHALAEDLIAVGLADAHTAEHFVDAVVAFCVASSLYHALLAVSVTDIRRSLYLLLRVQGALVVAAMSMDHIGNVAALALVVSLATLGTAVVASAELGVRALLREGRQATLHLDNGMGAVLPRASATFAFAGWLLVGVPGGITFFAEDLLFHSLLEISAWAVFGFVVASGLAVIAFYRLMMGLFEGPHPTQEARVDAVGVVAGGKTFDAPAMPRLSVERPLAASAKTPVQPQVSAATPAP